MYIYIYIHSILGGPVPREQAGAHLHLPLPACVLWEAPEKRCFSSSSSSSSSSNSSSSSITYVKREY